MKFDLQFDPPWMNAAGTLGFAPAPHAAIDPVQLGAFVTNPISRERRTPAHSERYHPFPGGFLLHTGYPNPGFKTVLQRHSGAWRRSPLPVIVHLLPRDPQDSAEMARTVENLECISAVEIGLPPDASPDEAVTLAASAAGELPVIVRLPVEQAEMLAAAITANMDEVIFSLAPPRGALPVNGGLRHGRLYGPGIFPHTLFAVEKLARRGYRVIGSGGVYSQDSGRAMLAAGAIAVQLDSVLWRGGFAAG